MADGRSDGIQDDVFRLCTKKNVEVEDYILRECFKVRESLMAAKRHNDSIVASVLSHVVMTDTPVDVMCEEWEARDDFETWMNKWRKYNASEKDDTHDYYMTRI